MSARASHCWLHNEIHLMDAVRGVFDLGNDSRPIGTMMHLLLSLLSSSSTRSDIICWQNSIIKGI